MEILKKIGYGVLITCFVLFAINNNVYADNQEINVLYDDDFISQNIEYINFQKEYINSITAKYRGENSEESWEINLKILEDNYDELICNSVIDIDLIDNYIEVYTAQKKCEEIETLMNKYKTNSYQEAIAAESNIRRSPVKYYKNYNRNNAVVYALNHYNNYNNSFPDWTSSGGDCANFISQCLHYGGIPMVGNAGNSDNEDMWYSYGNKQNLDNVSSTWRGANCFKEYWMKNSRYYYRYVNYKDAYDVAKIGDVIQLISSDKVAHHTYIIVGKDPEKKDLILACHTYDTKSARLSQKYNLYGGGFVLYAIK